MNCDILLEFVGKHVTLVTPITNQPITPEAIVSLFSGHLENFDDEFILLELIDGTHGAYPRHQILGIIENKVLDADDPAVKAQEKTDCSTLCNRKGSTETVDGSTEVCRGQDS